MALTVSATDTEVQKPVNVIYQQMLLRNARPLCPYFVGSSPGTLVPHGGSATLKWRRYNTSADHASGIATSTTALAELTGNASYMQGRSSATVHFSDVTATASKYGQFFILNEEVDVFLPNGTTAGIVRTLSITAGRSLNQLQRDVVEDNSTVIYAGNVASDGAVVSGPAVTDIANAVNVIVKNSAMPFTAMTTGSENINTVPMLPAFWGVVHPDVAYNISNLTGFVSVERYAGQVEVAPGEFGSLPTAGYTVRFLQTPEASVDANSGGSLGSTGLRSTGASVIDLYSIVIYGQDYHGSVGLGSSHGDGIFRGGDNPGTIEMIAKGRGTGRPSGTDDPFDEITTLAYKFWHAGTILNSNWGRVIRCGATDLTA